MMRKIVSCPVQICLLSRADSFPVVDITDYSDLFRAVSDPQREWADSPVVISCYVNTDLTDPSAEPFTAALIRSVVVGDNTKIHIQTDLSDDLLTTVMDPFIHAGLQVTTELKLETSAVICIKPFSLVRELSFYKECVVDIVILETDLPYPDYEAQYLSLFSCVSCFFPVKFTPTLRYHNDPDVITKNSDAVLISGGRGFAGDRRDWDPFLEKLKHVQDQKITVGICMGLQILAAINGGEVKARPDGVNFGFDEYTVLKSESWMLPASKTARLFACHGYEVVRLPASAELLASSPNNAHALVKIGPKSLGIQAHPEVRKRHLTPSFTKEGLDVRGIKDEKAHYALDSLKGYNSRKLVREWIRGYIAYMFLEQG